MRRDWVRPHNVEHALNLRDSGLARNINPRPCCRRQHAITGEIVGRFGYWPLPWPKISNAPWVVGIAPSRSQGCGMREPAATV